MRFHDAAVGAVLLPECCRQIRGRGRHGGKRSERAREREGAVSTLRKDTTGGGSGAGRQG
jgi:hypothetical protein